jgi:hypothetical protein
MTSTRASKTVERVGIAALLVASIAACSHGGNPEQPTLIPGPVLSDDEIDGPLASLPPELKARDFRLNPPLVLETGALPGRNDTTVVTVGLAPDPRVGATLTLQSDDGPIVLHDDGTEGDRVAGDHTFSLVVPSSFAALKRDMKAALAALEKRGVTSIPIFDGRVQVAEQKIASLPSANNQGGIDFPPAIPITKPQRTLFVIDPAVVGDKSRTFDPCAPAASAGDKLGKWTFGYLMQQMANNAATQTDPADMVLAWLNQWSTFQAVNGLQVPPRVGMADFISHWPKDSNGKLDLARAPLKLIAIVNRIDLAGNVAFGKVGGAEGRFIFAALDDSCQAEAFNVILEYGVPKTSCTELRDWARAWLALDTLTLGSTAYNNALEHLTETFAHAGAAPNKPAGSAINQVRSNEISLGSTADEPPRQWELREFALTNTGVGSKVALLESTVKQTPDANFNQEASGSRASDLARWINDNESAVIAQTDTVPLVLPFPPGSAFLGASTLNVLTNLGSFFPPPHLDYWTAPGINSNLARHMFSLCTCNGCHGDETHTGFRHVAGVAPAALSPFLTGEIVADPVNPQQTYKFGDLARRNTVLEKLGGAICSQILSGTPQNLPPPHVPSLPLPPVDFRPILSSH